MVVRRSRSVLLACTTLLALGLGTVSYAQTAAQNDAATDDTAPKGDRVTALKPITVKGKATKDVLADSPTTTETTAQEIDDKQINSIEDLGRSTEVGVGFNRTTGGVNIRGLGDDRVLTTVDGIEIPFCSTARAMPMVASTASASIRFRRSMSCVVPIPAVQVRVLLAARSCCARWSRKT